MSFKREVNRIRALLVSFAGYPYTPSSLMPDNGLASLAASLLDKNHEVRILDYGTVDTIRRLRIPGQQLQQFQQIGAKITSDLNSGKVPEQGDISELHSLEAQVEGAQQEEISSIAREVAEEAGRMSADFVGLKLWNGDGFTGSRIIADAFKKADPKLPVFAGGPHADWFKELILREIPSIDVLVTGDGEQTVVMLADYVAGKISLENIPNLIYRTNGDLKTTPKASVDISSLPTAVYDSEVYLSMAGSQKVKIIVLDESRGCPYTCAFCMHPSKSGNEWRKRSKDRVVDDIESMIERHGINAFVFAGSTTPPGLLKEIAQEIIDRGLEIDYTIFGNFRGTKPEDYELLAKSGCYAIFYGLESGSPYIREKALDKKVAQEKIVSAINAAKQAGIYVITSVIYPAPFETDATRQETLSLLLETRPDSVPVQFPGLIPGAKWMENPEQYNFKIHVDPDTYRRTALPYKFKLLFPPMLWDSLPYSCNGDNFKTLVRKGTQFAQELERNGILTAIPQDLALIVKHLGISPREFRDSYRAHFLTGNYQAIGEMVQKVNASVVGTNGS